MHKDLHNIDVPKEEIFGAIEAGIQQGQQLEKKLKRKKATLRLGYFSSAAAVLLLASGFVFSPVSNVLAQVPMIGSIYEKYQIPIGEQLASDQLVKEMSIIATDQDITLEVTSAFYDEAYIGLTFNVSGNGTNIVNGDPAPQAVFHFKYGPEYGQWQYDVPQLTKTKDGYTGAVLIDVPTFITQEKLSFPVEFMRLAGVQGSWAFDLNVEKIPVIEKNIDKKITAKSNPFNITFHQVHIGHTNVRISYTADYKHLAGKTYTFEAYDVNGEKINLNPIQIRDTVLLLDLSKNTSMITLIPILIHSETEQERMESVKIDLTS